MPYSQVPCFIFTSKELLDISVIHGYGTTTAAKKGGDNLGFSGHKHFKGDKVVAVCDRRSRQSERVASVAEITAASDPHCQAGRTRLEKYHLQL